MKKLSILLFFIIFCLALSPLGITAGAYTLPAGTELHAKSVYMVNLQTGTVVYQLNPEEKSYPASITKLVTALVVLDKYPDLSQKITAYDGVVDDLFGRGAATAAIAPGEVMTVEQLLYCLLVPSACDAANVLAMDACGNIYDFVELMNQKATALGMVNTHFTTAHGLHDDDQYTTAYDLYLLGREVIKHKELMTICGTYEYTLPATNRSGERFLQTTNYMMNPASSWYYHRVQGLKTGYTEQAGRNLLSLAEKDGQQYLTVVMGCPDEILHGYHMHHEFDDTDALLRWAYTDLDYLCIVRSTTPVAEVKVNLCADADHVTAVPKGDLYGIVPKKAADQPLLTAKLDAEELEAPIKKGQHLGTATVECAGEVVGTVELVAQQDCSRNLFMLIKDRVIKVIGSKIFLTIFAVLVIAVIAFAVWNVRINRRRRRLWNSKVRSRDRDR